jgi:uncharacterized membrane protein YphA (DoxX/SURF4 family)
MALAFLIGRIIVGVYFLMNAYNHLFKGAHMVGYAASKGVKSPKLAIMASGILILIGGLSILLGVAVSWGLFALILFLIPVSFKMHNYWKETDPMTKMNQQIAFMKNMALLGFVLMMFSIPTPWVYSF